MPVPSTISELSTTPANNSPAGTESPSTADDYLRTLSAFIATLNAADVAHVAAADPHPAYALETDVSATLANYAPLASAALTGTPTAPTAAAGTNTTQIATTAFAKAEAASAVPVGSVQYFALSSAPAGWLKANGALVSRTTYANLFAAIGTVFGAGDGSTTFALPDLRGEFIRGVDDGRGIDTGRTLGSAQADELKAHEHYVHPTGNSGADTRSFDVDYQTGDGLFFPRPTTSTGGAETRPRNVALLACIRY